MDVSEVLAEARQIVERGWCQHGYTDGRGNYCLRGAIGIASGLMRDYSGNVTYTPVSSDAERAAALERSKLDVRVAQLVCQHLPEPFVSIPVFNDQPDTTKNDVLAILDKAIASC